MSRDSIVTVLVDRTGTQLTEATGEELTCVGNLGGGMVETGPGEYLMRDSLHLRSRVTVRGAGEKPCLRKTASMVTLRVEL